MIRTLYRWLVWLHPPAFRRRFADEMLWIFDEAAKSERVSALFFDAVISLARQWLLRSGYWKVAAGVAGGLLQVAAGGLGMLMLGRAQIVSRLTGSHPRMPIEMSSLLVMTVWVVAGLLLMVILLSVWVKNLSEKRIAYARASSRNQALLRNSGS